MKIKQFNQEKFAINFLLFLVYLITLYPLTKIGFTVGDDIYTYVEFCKGHWAHIVGDLPYISGRFYLIFIRYVVAVPYLINNPTYFDIMYILPIALSFILFTRLIKRVFNSNPITLFAAILLASCFQIAGFHSITTAYPFYFTFSFCLILISFHLFISFYERNRKYLLYTSAIIMLIATLFYETYLVYYLVFLFIAIWKNNAFSLINKEKIIKIFKELFPFILGGVLYLIAYFGFQLFYPPKYDGAYISKDLTLCGLFQTATLMSKLSFPLQTYVDYRDVLLSHPTSLDATFKPYRIDLIIAIQGLIVVALAYYAMNKYKAIKYIHLLYGFIMGICLVYLPLLLVCASSRYYLASWNSYVPTFFSYFGYTLCLVMLLSAILNLLSFSKITRISFQILFCILLFWVTVITQTTNRAVAEDMELSSFRFEMAEDAIVKRTIPSLNTKTPICFEQANNTSSYFGTWVTDQSFSWKDYFVKLTGEKYNLTGRYKDFISNYKTNDKQVWVCFFRQSAKTNDALMYFAGLKGSKLPENQKDILCDNIITLYHSPYKEYNVSILTSGNNDTVYINSIPMQCSGNYHSINIAFYPKIDNNSTIFELRGKDLIASSLTISNILSNDNKVRTESIYKKTKKERIEEIILEIKNNPSWLKNAEKKAKERNISIEEAIRKEAQWHYNEEEQKI
ncbi:MAG: hypothetical protein H6Q15_638 [Bacteroidetes bacterium]|nr:hypothetical protein [Bacteroidota bacterium]